jgi:hypothetical protein
LLLAPTAGAGPRQVMIDGLRSTGVVDLSDTRE